jgi:hypothetical protein
MPPENQTFEIPSDPTTLKVLWAAMTAMVADIHAPQDQLTATEWFWAESLYQKFDQAVNQQKGST